MTADRYPDLFVYQYPAEAFGWPTCDDVHIVGRQYGPETTVLDWGWLDDDGHLRFLLVDNLNPEEPFVIIRVHVEALDVVLASETAETLRDATITWEA